MPKQEKNILVFNCGSSSLTYKVFNVKNPKAIERIFSGKAHRVGVTGTEPSFVETWMNGKVEKKIIPMKDHAEAAAVILEDVKNDHIPIHYVGHRFVHGGDHFQRTVFLSNDNMKLLKMCLSLAPLHNPSSFSVILECKRSLPQVQQYVTFDSAFHSSIPPVAFTYGLSKKIVKKFGFRKYGFHGLSYSYVSKEVARFLHTPLEKMKIVACHLGTGGSSVAAIKEGHSIDTSMGYTPLPGLMMSTRSGDVDPMLALYLMATYGYRAEELNDILNRKSGFLGISSFSSDIRDIIKRIDEKSENQSELALKMYVHRLKKYIGSYIAALGGIDVLAFTDDIGVNSWQVRERVCRDMEWCGIELDETANRKAAKDKISVLNSKKRQVKILTVPTEEELVICWEGINLIGDNHDAAV
ncbi:MAG: acetate/propionate family kinase [Bacteroidota bacterium]